MCLFTNLTSSMLEVEFMHGENVLVHWALRNSYLSWFPLSNLSSFLYPWPQLSEHDIFWLSPCLSILLPFLGSSGVSEYFCHIPTLDNWLDHFNCWYLVFFLIYSIIYFISFILVFWDRVSLCNTGWPRICYSYPNSFPSTKSAGMSHHT